MIDTDPERLVQPAIDCHPEAAACITQGGTVPSPNTEARISVLLRCATLAADGPVPGVAWMTELGDFFALGYSAPELEAGSDLAQPTLRPAPAPVFSLQLLSCGIRYDTGTSGSSEPPTHPTAHAAVNVDSLELVVTPNATRQVSNVRNSQSFLDLSAINVYVLLAYYWTIAFRFRHCRIY